MKPSSSSLSKRSPPLGFRRVEDLWFPNGTIILQSASSATRFRVYADSLEAQSVPLTEIFKREPFTPFKYEGCFVYELPDSTQELEHFLRAFFDAPTGFFASKSTTEWAVVEAVLRLATKYQVAHLREQAIQFLREAYPSTRSAWESRRDQRHFSVDTPFRAVNLARAMDVPEILPAALFHACHHSLEQILMGVAIPPKDPRERPKVIELSPSDRILCVIGRQRLGVLNESLLLRALKVSADETQFLPCENRHLCLYVRFEMLVRANELKADSMLRTLKWETSHGKLCGPCFERGRRSLVFGKERMWDSLPTLFKLDDRA